MVTITKEHIIYEFDKNASPAGYINPGETAKFETLDCYNGQLLPENSTRADMNRDYLNPATGPLYIHGAEPGDTLALHIRKLEVAPVGILDVGPNSGVLKEHFPDAVIRRLPVVDGKILYREDVAVLAKPMIGVIGVAPDGEPQQTVVPMDHGGNMDCVKIEEGATLYLPVFVEGALLSTGDFHAIMGDGEVANCGLEIGGTVELDIELIKHTNWTTPMIRNDKQWITIGYGATLEEASQKTVRQMFAFLTEKKGMTKVDAAMLIDMAGDLIICQLVNPYMTTRMEIPIELMDKMLASKAEKE